MAHRGNRPDTLNQDAARRMWSAGMSRREIAAQLNIGVDTVSKWRRVQGWANRKAYADRPLTARRKTHDVDALGERVSVEPGRITYACPHCGLRALERIGHPQCQVAA